MHSYSCMMLFSLFLVNYVLILGAAPGCLLRGEGGGGVKCLATAARTKHFCASPEKVARGGGGGAELTSTRKKTRRS